MKKRKNEAIWVEKANRWQINVTKDGIRKTFVSAARGKKGKIAAETKADEWLEKGSVENIRLMNAWKRFLDDKAENCGTAWVRKLRGIGDTWLLPNLQYKKIRDITRQDWQNCINSAYKSGRSKKTLENIRGAISNFYTYCEMNRIEMEEPRRLKVPDNAPVGERNILQPEEIQTLFSENTIMQYGKPKECIYINAWRLAVVLGLRRGELAGLKSSDIKGNILYISRSIGDGMEITAGKTKNARRAILLPQIAQNIMEDQARMLKARGIVSPWIFPDAYGDCSNPSSMYKQWIAYRKQHAINSSIHELRHTSVSFLKSEMSEDLLKQLIGHSKTMDTGRYKHAVRSDLEKTSSIIDKVFDALI